MDTIKSYIDHMFKALPATTEVRRAKDDLLQVSEDRYAELRDAGMSEHEAVGRVITQFGDLDEVADELGIRAQVDGLGPDAQVDMTDEDAERYLAMTRRSALFIGSGVLVVLLGVAGLVGLGAWSGAGDDRMGVLGLTTLFVAIAIAVALFLMGSIPMQRFERYEDRGIVLSPQATAHYRAMRERETNGFIAGLAGGIAVILLAVITMVAVPVLFGAEPGAGDSLTEAAGVPIGMVLIGIGTFLIILVSIRRGALSRLAREGDYSRDALDESENLVSRLAGPFWLLALLVFLVWSFVGNAWDRSWIVWPVAGVTWGLVAATASAFTPRRNA